TTDRASLLPACVRVVYRGEPPSRIRQADAPGPNVALYVRNSDEARASLQDYWRKADSESRKLASRLLRETHRNPIARYWVSGGTTYVDMSLYAGCDIVDTAHNFPRTLAHFDQCSGGFADYHQQIGMLGKPLAAESSSRAHIPHGWPDCS